MLFSLILLFSCTGLGGETNFKGFQFSIWNDTQQVLEAKIIIGGEQNGNYIATDSVLIEEIKIGGNNPSPFFLNENRWKPDLDKIRNIPANECFFVIDLSNGRRERIGRFQSNELFSLQLPNVYHFTGDRGDILLSIKDSEVTASTVAESD